MCSSLQHVRCNWVTIQVTPWIQTERGVQRHVTQRCENCYRIRVIVSKRTGVGVESR